MLPATSPVSAIILSGIKLVKTGSNIPVIMLTIPVAMVMLLVLKAKSPSDKNPNPNKEYAITIYNSFSLARVKILNLRIS